ncbi:hypothetical protein BGZ60DRAFT_387648, partial [Tricladium varicosporioides]
VAYGITILIPLSMGCAKFSILLLYQRIFEVDRHFSISIKVVAILNTLWVIGAILACVFICMPVRKFWDRKVPGKCDNLAQFFLAVEIPNSLIDFVMIILPMIVIRKLRIRTKDKVILGLIFIMGGMVGVIGFIRIGIIYSPSSYSERVNGFWVTVQLAMAVLCCCIPTYRPLLKQIKVPDSLRSRLGNRSRSTNTGSNKSTLAEGSHKYNRQQDGLGDFGWDGDALTKVGANTYGDGNRGKVYPLKSIRVESTVEIV